jgi:hypothetical protein
VDGADELGLRGAVLDGQFRVDAPAVAAPNAAIVGYAAHDVARNLPVFVKIVRPIPGLAQDALPELHERLRLDGAAAHHLSNESPHVRRVLSAGQMTLPGQPQLGPVSYRVVEQLRGPSLHAHLATAGPQAPPTALAMLEPIFLALQAAEGRRFLHGTVSPIAVLLEPTLPTSTGPSTLAKLDDGGLTPTVTRFLWDRWGQGPLEGRTFDPLFAPPEYFRDGRCAFSSGTDLYGLALTFLAVLLGRPPRMATTTRALAEIPHTPDSLASQGLAADPALLSVLCHGLAPDPTQRPESVAHFWDALRRAVALGESTGGFTKKGTKVLPLDQVPPVRAGTIPMPKREAPDMIVESVTAAGAKKDPFKIDPFAQTFGADAARPGVSPLASTVPPGKGPTSDDVRAALAQHAPAVQVINAPGAPVGPGASALGGAAGTNNSLAYSPPAAPGSGGAGPELGAPVGAGGGSAPASTPYGPAPHPPQSPGMAPPPGLAEARSSFVSQPPPPLIPPSYEDTTEEKTPVWVWIILPVAGLAILALLGFIVALLFGWDPRLL